RIVVQHDSVLTPEVLTLQMWVKTGLSQTNLRFILKRITLPLYDESYSLGLDPDGRFTAMMSSGTGAYGSQVMLRQKGMPIQNKWYFLSVVYSEDSMRLYLDGQLEGKIKTGFPIYKGD